MYTQSTMVYEDNEIEPGKQIDGKTIASWHVYNTNPRYYLNNRPVYSITIEFEVGESLFAYMVQ